MHLGCFLKLPRSGPPSKAGLACLGRDKAAGFPWAWHKAFKDVGIVEFRASSIRVCPACVVLGHANVRGDALHLATNRKQIQQKK